MYYICNYETHKAIFGPYKTSFTAADVIHNFAKDRQQFYCVMSRYMLAKTQKYPNTKAGNTALEADLRA